MLPLNEWAKTLSQCSRFQITFGLFPLKHDACLVVFVPWLRCWTISRRGPNRTEMRCAMPMPKCPPSARLKPSIRRTHNDDYGTRKCAYKMRKMVQIKWEEAHGVGMRTTRNVFCFSHRKYAALPYYWMWDERMKHFRRLACLVTTARSGDNRNGDAAQCERRWAQHPTMCYKSWRESRIFRPHWFSSLLLSAPLVAKSYRGENRMRYVIEYGFVRFRRWMNAVLWSAPFAHWPWINFKCNLISNRCIGPLFSNSQHRAHAFPLRWTHYDPPATSCFSGKHAFLCSILPVAFCDNLHSNNHLIMLELYWSLFTTKKSTKKQCRRILRLLHRRSRSKPFNNEMKPPAASTNNSFYCQSRQNAISQHSLSLENLLFTNESTLSGPWKSFDCLSNPKNFKILMSQ